MDRCHNRPGTSPVYAQSLSNRVGFCPQPLSHGFCYDSTPFGFGCCPFVEGLPVLHLNPDGTKKIPRNLDNVS